MIRRFRDINIATGVDGHVLELAQSRGECGHCFQTVSARRSVRSRSAERHTSLRDEQIAGRIEGQAARAAKATVAELASPDELTSSTSPALVSAMKTSPAASTATPSGKLRAEVDDRLFASRRHLEYAVILGVGDEEVAGGVDSQSHRSSEPRHDRGLHSRRRDLDHAVILEITDEHFSHCVDCHAGGLREPRGRHDRLRAAPASMPDALATYPCAPP